ncbi:MAG: cupin domain-containing protein [Oscillospiraceae bacterium]|nr:cupin domain-containing protein [Oscillospiraceae bacterium]
MSANLKMDSLFTKHPTQEGVFMKHFFGKDDNNRLNNLEVNIIPGFQIAPHTHEESSEFFFVVNGAGEFLDDTEWKPIQKGDAFKAPQGMTHGLKNTGNETLVLFSTFSPAIR